MLMSLNICQLVLIHRPLEARPCSVPDREKMAIDALSLLVRRAARSEGTEWISEEGVAAGPPREPSVDTYSLPSPDLWQVDGWQKADFDWTRNEMSVGSPVSHRAIDGCSLMCLVQSVLQQVMCFPVPSVTYFPLLWTCPCSSNESNNGYRVSSPYYELIAVLYRERREQAREHKGDLHREREKQTPR